MISDRVRAAVARAAMEAMLDAREQHGDYFNSSHEGVAVIREEVEEAIEDAIDMGEKLNHMWQGVRHDLNREAEDAEKISNAAERCATECSQVMAMCTKMIETKKNT